MNLRTFICIGCLTLILFSCKKKDSSNSSVTVPGYWTGWWSNGGSSAHNNMSVVFREGGTARVIYGYVSDTTTAVYKSEGTFSLQDNILRFFYDEGSYTFLHKANFSANMSGTWGTSPSETDGGLFELHKN